MIPHLKLFANQVKSIIMAINQTMRPDPVAMTVTFCKQLFCFRLKSHSDHWLE